ncbi:sialidase family protein [Chryseolinea sp. H1M3-3]|uniref:sialidase family protein n=1 Tax=Chryseolinea sp. H1M3-3 TaxID=3034144 RepID=UPI0023EAEA11|nr:sialidase family protein [Chryseolinea sp. H1M3-3]
MKYGIYLIFASLLLVGCYSEKVHQKISSAESSAESVYLTHDTQGNPVVVWTEKKNDSLTLFYAVSTDGGKSFSKKVSIPISADVATHAEGMPKVAFKKDGSIIAAYEKKAPTQQNKYAGAIYYMMSEDGGQSWTEERFLHSDTVAGRSRSYFDIERLPDGEIGASWLDIKLNNATGGRSVRFARTMKSKGFGNEILVDSSACQCCRIDVYTDKSENIFIAYRGLKRGDMGKQIRDMMIATSTDHGASFSSPLLISADNWNIDGCPHTGPSLCGNKAGLLSLWYTEGSGTGIYYAHKPEGKREFSQRQLISNAGRHPQLCANDNRIAMLWEENIDSLGKSTTLIKYRIVKDGTEVDKNTLTPTDMNAFLPVITQTKEGFLSAFLMEENNIVGVYFRRL